MMSWLVEADFLDKQNPAVTIAKIVFKHLFELYPNKTISDIAETTSGGTPLRGHSDYYGGNIPWIKSGELNDGLITEYEETITEKGLKNSSAKIYPKGTLVLALYGATAGKTGILNFDSASNQAVAAVYQRDNIERDYLFWFFRQKRSEYIEMSFGAAQPNISQAVVKQTLVPVPDKSIQKEIAAFLKFYESSGAIALPVHLKKIKEQINRVHKIILNRKLLLRETTLQQAHLQQLRQAILQEAVQGKLTKQDPNDEPAEKLLQRIKAEKQKLIAAGKLKKEKEFSGLGQKSLMFDLPMGWTSCRLGDICHLITDGTHHTPKYVTDGVPFISVKNLSQGILDFSDTKFITQKNHNDLIKRCNPEFGDILLTKVGTTGIAKIVDIDRPFSIFVSVALLKFDQKLIFNKFLELLINSPIVKKQSEEGTEGIGNKNLVLKKINSFLIPLPPLSEQRRIVAKVEQLMQRVNELEQQVQQSKEQAGQLLQAVLKEAFVGKIKEYKINDAVTMAAEG